MAVEVLGCCGTVAYKMGPETNSPFFFGQFCYKTALSNKTLLVSLVLEYIALQGCIDALYRGIPCTFTLICPFMVLLQP